MTTESKPPMRQIAELIDEIATARAESAERLLGECETQLIEARLGEKAALETIADRDAEIARLKAELGAERERTTATQIFPPAPPAEDPRIAALCRVVEHLADPTWPKPFGGYGTSQQFCTDLETITGRR